MNGVLFNPVPFALEFLSWVVNGVSWLSTPFIEKEVIVRCTRENGSRKKLIRYVPIL